MLNASPLADVWLTHLSKFAEIWLVVAQGKDGRSLSKFREIAIAGSGLIHHC
jgi:hypothetical protein